MKPPRIAEAMNYIDDELIAEAVMYRRAPLPSRLFRKPIWKACACFFAIAFLFCFGIIGLGKHSAETFSLTAYAASSEGGVITIEMHKGQSVPVSEFETPGGMKGIVFSYDAENPFQPASVSVIVDGINSEETVQEISELKMENGKIYLLYIIPNDGKPQHTFPYVITEKSAGTVTLFTIAIEQDGSNYTAKIEKVSTNKRKIK